MGATLSRCGVAIINEWAAGAEAQHATGWSASEVADASRPNARLREDEPKRSHSGDAPERAPVDAGRCDFVTL
ncbi:MAG TPA: hypothetical protein VGR63_07645 [Casimicrobiaceae bacterium]|jgi:hypothetical protein|nr:hypothetical protein [Casimicrobiaceae bacterium]